MSDFNEFSDQSFRLLRQKWTDPNSLAQEIYAMVADTSGLKLASRGLQPLSAVSSDVQHRSDEARIQDIALANAMPSTPKRLSPQRVDTPWVTPQPYNPGSFVASLRADPGEMVSKPKDWERSGSHDGVSSASGPRQGEPEASRSKVLQPQQSHQITIGYPSSVGFPQVDPVHSPAQSQWVDPPPFTQYQAPPTKAMSTPAWTEPVGLSYPESILAHEQEAAILADIKCPPGMSPSKAQESSARATQRLSRSSGGGVGFYGGTIPAGDFRMGNDAMVTAYPVTPNTKQVNPYFGRPVTTPEDPLIQKGYSLNIPVTDFNSPAFLPDAGGASAYQGVVVSCTGTMPNALDTVNSGQSVTAVVQLYSNGPNTAPDDTGPNNESGGQIVVGIIGLLLSEVIASGTWISGIAMVQYGDGPTTEYWAQVPTWQA